MPGQAERYRDVERHVTYVRVLFGLFVLLTLLLARHLPHGYLVAGWILAGFFAAGTAVFYGLAGSGRPAMWPTVGLVSLVFDAGAVAGFGVIFAYEYGNQTRLAMILPVLEAALRFGPLGGGVVPILLIPYWWFSEWWRARQFAPPGYALDRVTFPAGVVLLSGLIVGWLVGRLDNEVRSNRGRAAEAERLRDELGRRVDVLEAANRSARALGSSLEIEDAFGAFIRELRGLVPFDRTAVVLVEEANARTIATAGRGAQQVFPPGSSGPLAGTVLERVLGGEVVVRDDLAEEDYPEDSHLLELGLHSELLAPLMVGARAIGMISLSRAEVASFSPADAELVALLGRVVATAVQNIRAYEAERQTVEELRRLSALRADFVSLVSHELRSPMAAVIGAARTLQERWRLLSSEQRDAFLGLIGDETNRLASLIGDVLDTSRIEAGTFSFSFTDVDLGRLVRDAVSSAAVGQDEVRVQVEVAGTLPAVRGDRERLRQVLANLIDNAVKYSPSGGEVSVTARRENGAVRIDVRDSGPGIPLDQQRIIFEKFGRAGVTGSKPGTGLGLFIARSIAEAHGGTLEVSSRPDDGATFTLTLPA